MYAERRRKVYPPSECTKTTKGGRMTRKKTRPLTDRIIRGPGKDEVEQIIRDLIDRKPIKKFPEFGNGYRGYPIRVSSVEVIMDKTETLFTFDGVLDFSQAGYPNFGGERVRIRRYSAHFRDADGADVLL